MNQKQDNLITVLDAGSTKSCVLVAELQDGVLRYRGHGVEPSRGMRKGLIAELGPAAEAINRAALTAERMAKVGIETAVVGIGGTHVRGVNSRGGRLSRSAWLSWVIPLSRPLTSCWTATAYCGALSLRAA